MKWKLLMVVGCLSAFCTTCRNQPETVINLRIPQTHSNPIRYEVNSHETLIAVSEGGVSKELPLKYTPGQRYEQVGVELYVWNVVGFETLEIFSPQGTHATIALETAGDVYFITNRNTGYMSGWFQNKKLFIDLFDSSGKKVSGDFFEFEITTDLYTATKLFALHFEGEIWVWTPAHGKILIFNQDGVHRETFNADSATLKRFDGLRVEDLWAAEESGDLERLKKMVREREGEAIKAEAMNFFLYRGVPTFGFNTGLLSPELNDNQFYVHREAVLEEVKGPGIYKYKNCELGGLSQDKLFLFDFSVPSAAKKILVK